MKLCTVMVYIILMPEPKTEQVHVRVSPNDKNAIDREATRLGLSVSAYFLFLHRQHVNQHGENTDRRP